MGLHMCLRLRLQFQPLIFFHTSVTIHKSSSIIAWHHIRCSSWQICLKCVSYMCKQIHLNHLPQRFRRAIWMTGLQHYNSIVSCMCLCVVLLFVQIYTIWLHTTIAWRVLATEVRETCFLNLISFSNEIIYVLKSFHTVLIFPLFFYGSDSFKVWLVPALKNIVWEYLMHYPLVHLLAKQDEHLQEVDVDIS